MVGPPSANPNVRLAHFARRMGYRTPTSSTPMTGYDVCTLALLLLYLYTLTDAVPGL